MTTILDLKPIIQLNSENFYQLCQHNPDISLGIELSKNGKLIIVSPAWGGSGNQESRIETGFSHIKGI